jgi:hypothetical protein
MTYDELPKALISFSLEGGEECTYTDDFKS